MLHFFVLVTQTLLTASMMTGFLLGYARQRGLLEIRAPAARGVMAGAVVAVVLAGLEYTTALVVREYYNLVLLLVIVCLQVFLAGLLGSTRALPPEKAAGPFMRMLFFLTLAGWGAFYLPDIFIYPSHFAVGVVKVLSSEFVFIVTGYLAGLLVCFLLGLATFRVCAALPEKRLFALFALALAAYALSQTIGIGQILLGRGLLPRTDWALDLIILLLNNADLLFYAATGSAALAACLLWRANALAHIEGDNPARRRKARSLARSRMRWSRFLLLLLAAGILTLTAGRWYDNLGVTLDPPVSVTATDGMIVLPLTLVGDGALHRFAYTGSKGVTVRFIVIKKSEAAYGVGLDACDVCGPSGYFERKGQVVCILCDVVMNKSTIGFAGGCNPVPLAFAVREGQLLIKTADLEAEAPRFL